MVLNVFLTKLLSLTFITVTHKKHLRCVGTRSNQALLNCKLDADDDKLKVTVDSLRLFGGKLTSGKEL